MARHASIGTMIAATALIAWPVLAQTTSATSPAAAPVAARHDVEPHHDHDHDDQPGDTTAASPRRARRSTSPPTIRCA